MKKNHKFKKFLSVWIMVMFIANLFIPTVVLATEITASENSIEVTIERRVLGEGDILSVTKQPIIQGEKASVSLDRVLKTLGIDYEYTGTLENSFYISAIKTPEGEFLSEFDHGFVSGWKYSVNDISPTVGLSDYQFKNGDKVRIQYTAKDMGQDILVVDTIYKIREKIVEAEKLPKDNYTEVSFNNLQDEIAKVKVQMPSDIQIGEMMSSTLGTGECDTFEYGKKMEELLKGLENSIVALEEKPTEPEVPQIVPEFNIDMFSTWDKVDDNRTEQPNTVYLPEGKQSIGARLVRLKEANMPILFNGKELTIVDGSALLELTPGIHSLSVTRWGRPYEVAIECRTLPYTIEGDNTPGGTVTINFNGGVEEGLKDINRYKLKETVLEYNTNIPGLKKVTSETIVGAPVDRERLSKVTFTIPEDTEPGEYELNSGSVYQTWGGYSFNGRFKGSFSVFPNIKLNVAAKIDLSKAYDIDLSKWSEFDKVYTLEDSTLLKLVGINTDSKVSVNGDNINPIDGIYAAKLPVGDNVVVVDGQEYKILCKKISYSISNANSIIPGKKVLIKFEGLEEGFSYIPGRYNSQDLRTIYNTDLHGVDLVKSESAGTHTSVDREILNTLAFEVPIGTEPGIYTLSNGSIYQWWYGEGLIGATEKEWAYEKNFSILPKIQFQVRDSIPEDKEAPIISTNLNDNDIVPKEKLNFRVIISDNIDSIIKPTVKLNNKVIEGNASGEYSVVLNEGENKIEIEAIDVAGNKAVKAYTINYKPKLREGAGIILDTLNLVLKEGQTHQIIAVDSPDMRSNESDNTAKMTYEVTNGNDVVKVSKTGLIEGIKPGFAEVSVRYPGLTIPATVQVQVRGEKEANGPRIITSIKETKYDTFYYLEDSYDYGFTVDAEDSDITVMFNGNEALKDDEGSYKVKLAEGYNVIKVMASKKGVTSYETYTLRAQKVSINVENITSPGQEILQGDKVKVSFKGIETPVPKFLRVYNPKRTRVEYKTDMPGATNIYGKPTQYDVATNNAIEFIASTAGTFNFTGGNIEEAWWGDELFSERDISGDGPNMSAVVRQGNFSRLPNFTIDIKENNDYKNNYTVEILNKEPIKAGDKITLKVNNLEMPEVDRGTIIQASTIFNTDIEGLNEIQSEDAAEDFSKLQTINFKVPENTKPGEYTITNGRVFKEWQPGVLYVDSEFYKGELPEIKLVVTGDEPEPVPPLDTTTPVEVVSPSMTVDEGINHAIKWTMDNVKNPTFGNEWDILGLVRSGLFNDKEYLNTYYNNLVNVIKEKKGILTRNKYTEYSRTIIALTALGKDPRDIGGYNLVEKLYDFKKVSAQGINGVIFALIALDTNNYEIPKDANNSRERMIQTILDSQLQDGGFALSSKVGNVDVTGMALQALAKYKEQPEVKQVIDKGVKFLSQVQLADGGYSSDEVKNIEADVQGLVALTRLGIEPRSEGFVKNKNWIISDIMNFAADGSGFKHSLDQGAANDMATEQALYGLAAYRRFTNGETTIYDMSDVALDNGGDSGNNGGDNGNGGNGDNGSSEGSGGSDSENGGNSGSGNQGEAGGQEGSGSPNQGGTGNGNQGLGNNSGNGSGNQGALGQGNNNLAVNDNKEKDQALTEKEQTSEKKKEEKAKPSKEDTSEKDDTEKEGICTIHGENYNVGTGKQPLSNIQVVFLTLAVVFVVSAIKEVVVTQYKKKKKQSEDK